jgi:hypothetical protein
MTLHNICHTGLLKKKRLTLAVLRLVEFDIL